MALTLDEAQRMTEAAEKHGVQLLCGHTASLMAANQAMRRLITSGTIGDVQAINVWSYTDWMFRPRMPQSWTSAPAAASFTARAHIRWIPSACWVAGGCAAYAP